MDPVEVPITRGSVTILDAYPKNMIHDVNNQISLDLGSKPATSGGRLTQSIGGAEGLNRQVDFTIFRWEPGSDARRPGALQEVHAFSSSALPYYLVVGRISIPKSRLGDVSGIVDRLERVVQPERELFMSWRPASLRRSGMVVYPPMAMTLRAVARQPVIDRLGEAIGAAAASQQLAFDDLISKNKELRELLPLRKRNELDVRTYFWSATNSIAVVGHAGQASLGGMRSPFVLTLATEEFELPPESDAVPFPSMSLSTLNFLGSHGLLLPVASLRWLDLVEGSIGELEKRTADFRRRLVGLHQHRAVVDLLLEMNSVGRETASLGYDLHQFSRAFGPFVRETGNDLMPWQVVAFSPPIDWPRWDLTVDTAWRTGYLGKLSGRITAAMQSAEDQLQSLREDIGALRSSAEAEADLEASRIQLRHSKTLTGLTWAIAFLTVALLALAMGQILGWI